MPRTGAVRGQPAPERRARASSGRSSSGNGSDKSSDSDLLTRGSKEAKERRRTGGQRARQGARKDSGSGSAGSGSGSRSDGSAEGRRDREGRVTIDSQRMKRRRNERRGTESTKRATPPDGSPKNVSDDDANDGGRLSPSEAHETLTGDFAVRCLEKAMSEGLQPCKIFGRRKRDRKTEYIVRWEGKAHIANTWVRGEQLRSTHPELVADFDAEYADRNDVVLVKCDWLIPQRVVNVTGIPPSTQLLVKWWGLPYVDCTWEKLDGHSLLPDLLERYIQFDHENLGRSYTAPTKTAHIEPYEPCRIMQSVTKWMLATWLENEGVCFVDNSPQSRHVEVAAAFVSERKWKHTKSATTLIIVGEHDLNHWCRQFARYAPGVNVVEYGGSATCRATVQQHEWSFGGLVSGGETLPQPRFNVLLTTYSTAMLDIVLLRQIVWDSVILYDGSPMLSAEASSLMARLGTLKSSHRALMFKSANFSELHITLNILDFLKRSPESMRNLESRLLNVSREEACMQTAALLAVVTMDYQFCEDALKNQESLNGENVCMGTLHTARLLELSEIVLASKTAKNNGADSTPVKDQDRVSVFPESFDFSSQRYLGFLHQLQALHNLYRSPVES